MDDRRQDSYESNLWKCQTPTKDLRFNFANAAALEEGGSVSLNWWRKACWETGSEGSTRHQRDMCVSSLAGCLRLWYVHEVRDRIRTARSESLLRVRKCFQMIHFSFLFFFSSAKWNLGKISHRQENLNSSVLLWIGLIGLACCLNDTRNNPA